MVARRRARYRALKLVLKHSPGKPDAPPGAQARQPPFLKAAYAQLHAPPVATCRGRVRGSGGGWRYSSASATAPSCRDERLILAARLTGVSGVASRDDAVSSAVVLYFVIAPDDLKEDLRDKLLSDVTDPFKRNRQD